MPVIDSYQQQKRTEKFKKKAYRSWDDVDQNAGVVLEELEYKEAQKDETISQENISTVFNDDKEKNSTLHPRDFEQIKILATTQQKNPIKPEITETSSMERVAFALRGLRSVQRQLVFFIADLCITRRQLSSGPIDQAMLIEACQTNINIIRNAIERLTKKGFLVREVGKKGYGGFSSFLISETLRNVIAQELQQPKSDKKFVDLSSHRSNAMVQKDLNPSLPEEWASIDFSPLEHLQFTTNHIEQLYALKKLTAQQVQESIYAFDFDLRENSAQKNLRVGPLNFFMGILRKGTPFAPPQNYEDPLEKALKAYIFLSENREKNRQELEKKAIELAFNGWEKTLPTEEILRICENRPFANDLASIQRKGVLIGYFKEYVWPSIQSALVGQTQNDSTAN